MPAGASMLLPAVEAPSDHTHACTHALVTCTPSTSNDESSGRPSASNLRQKSAKRRAAEALLQRRFSSPVLDAAAAGAGAVTGAATAGGSGSEAKRQRAEQQHQQPQRPPVHVAACSDCGGGAHATPAAAVAADVWCSQDVALPPMDWPAVLQSVEQERDITLDHQANCYQLPGNIRVHVVVRADQLPAALSALRHSMQDTCVAIDLEWKPEGWCGNGPTRVALMQLASATVAVLVRISQLGFRMPAPLHAFLSDPELSFVGFSWDSADEGKMQQTFGAGRSLFARFHDLQQIGVSLGYHGFGLGALTKQVLGFQPPKCRKVTMSNWEARQLSAKQVQYAALDAIITGHIYRGLRLWHASPSACTSCRQMLGAELPMPKWQCLDCDRSFHNGSSLISHKHQKGHRVTPSVCGECGRARMTAA